jgi:hypothetical protein
MNIGLIIAVVIFTISLLVTFDIIKLPNYNKNNVTTTPITTTTITNVKPNSITTTTTIPTATISIIPQPNKNRWPELIGKNKDYSKDIISGERPDLIVRFVLEGSSVTSDMRYDRVRIYHDINTIVTREPIIK